ncbi:cytochrome P450 [Streptomyces sp. NPDC007325]|uniref:cytochrome P450 n=1 Tax=Streptomyces sp. NPDC007325 TaxID=3154588 RepID=UPI0033F77E0B
MYRHPDLYDRPHTFDPDRWPAKPGSALPRGAYVAFGAGPASASATSTAWPNWS